MIYKKNKFTIHHNELNLDIEEFFLKDVEGGIVHGFSDGRYTEYTHFFKDLDSNHRIEVQEYIDYTRYFLVIHNVYLECGDMVGVRQALLIYLESAFPSVYNKYIKLENEVLKNEL